MVYLLQMCKSVFLKQIFVTVRLRERVQLGVITHGCAVLCTEGLYPLILPSFTSQIPHPLSSNPRQEISFLFTSGHGNVVVNLAQVWAAVRG